MKNRDNTSFIELLVTPNLIIPQPIPQILIDKYGEKLSRDIMIEHILLDYKDGTLSKEDIKEIKNQKNEKSKGAKLVISWGLYGMLGFRW